MFLKNQIKIMYFFSGIVILLLLFLNVNTFYWADDYAFINDLNTNGIFQNCIIGYNTWDGRMLSVASFVQCFLLKNVAVELITLFWSICFLASGILFFYILSEDLKLSFGRKYQKLLVAIVFSISAWLGAYMHFSETIYWATGGFYSFSLLLGAVWILLFIKIQNVQIKIGYKNFFFIYSFIVGGTTQNLSIALLTLIGIHMVYNYLKKIETTTSYNSWIFFSVLLGLLFILFAPGNSFRMEASGFSELTFLKFFKNILFVLFYYFCYSIVAIVLSIAFTYAIFKLFYKNSKFNKFPKIGLPKTQEEFINLVFDFKWFWVAISTILPFIFIPNLTAKRTVIFFIFFIILFVCSIIYRTLQRSFILQNPQITNKKQTAFNIFFCILFVTTLFVIYNFKKGLVLKKAITERENICKKSRGKTVYLQLIDQDLTSPCYHFFDFYILKEDNYIKKSQELYFGVKIIIGK